MLIYSLALEEHTGYPLYLIRALITWGNRLFAPPKKLFTLSSGPVLMLWLLETGLCTNHD